jgi:hypothetical protein
MKTYLLHACFLLGLFFDPEDGGDMFLRNVGRLAMDYTTLCPGDRNIFIVVLILN